MDKLTAIKIKYDDGTYSDEIPVSVLSENVEWDSTHTLVDVLGSINVDVTGTIQDQISQLFNEKVSNGAMQAYVSNEMPTYINTWLQNNVNPVGSAVIVDNSLTISGAAADAKIVGDKINKSEKAGINRINFLELEQGTINSQGVLVDSNLRLRTKTKISYPMYVETFNTAIQISAYVIYYMDTDNFISYKPLPNSTSINISEIEENTYIKLVFKYRDDSAISIGDLQPDLTVKQITQNTENISNLTKTTKNISEAITISKNLNDQFIKDSLINTSYGSIGTIIDPTIQSNGFLNCLILPCVIGDKFIISGTGANTGRLWCFTDDNYKKLSVAAQGAVANNLTLFAEQNGYFIVNVMKNAEYSVNSFQYANIQEIIDNLNPDPDKKETNITNLTDPHKLFWRMGAFDRNGPQGGTPSQTRMWTSCRVKAGSTIVAKSENHVEIQYGYKIDDSQTALDYYESYGYKNITIEQECTVFIGVLYTSPIYLPNDSIVDALEINLYAIDFKSKFSKKDRVFGRIPIQHYIGQHEDTTGWDLNTSDVNAIHAAFDTLISDSNGYMTKTDLGVSYDTYHMYQYTTVPVGNHASGGIDVPKVAIVCCEHGNEKMSAYSMHYLMYDLIHNAHKNPVLMYLRANCIISFIPIANPWGFINRSRFNENGVNLNRNFPTYHWDNYSDETSEQGGINYKGTAPASEEQTKQIIAFLRKNYDAAFMIDLHTNGENTSAWYEISTAIINNNGDSDSDDYKIQSSYYIPSKVNTNMIKPWMDGEFEFNLGNVFYGNVSYPEPDRPTTAQWARESNNMVGITYEILAGSRDGYLGENLDNYSPDTIKAGAELLGDYIISMLANCEKQ